MRAALVAPVVALVVGAVGASAGSSAPQPAEPLARLVGQRLVVALRGTAPSISLLARIRRGEVGGVILFGGNVRSIAQVAVLTRALRAAATIGGRPAPLVLVDQEGGSVRRLRWAPPARSAAELGAVPTAAVRASGRATAVALRSVGIDVDLAPVSDVPGVTGSFVAAQQRAFSRDPRLVSTQANAFALGLADGHVAATAKHFPGLGRATVSTDVAAVEIGGPAAALEADLLPYRSLIASGVPLVMLSNAAYAALDGKPAAWSPAVQTLLRRTLAFDGVTITDALEAAATTHRRTVPSVAVLAAQAGTDLLLLVGSETESARVYRRLLAAAGAGTLPRAGLERSYARIVALKKMLSGRA